MDRTFAKKKSGEQIQKAAEVSSPSTNKPEGSLGMAAGMPLFLQRSPSLNSGSQTLQRQEEEEEREPAVEEEETLQTKRPTTEAITLQRQEEDSPDLEDEEKQTLQTQLQPAHLGILQRQTEEDELPPEAEPPEEETTVQTKLTVNPPNDVYEQEADQVAETVVQRSNTPLAVSSIPSQIQRKCAACEAEDEQGLAEDRVQRKSDDQEAIAPALLQTKLEPASSGAPLSESVRQQVEPVLDTDLSDVRVHSHPADQETARSLHARAFTHQNHIWLGPGQSADDVKLMAHESAHVVQQSSGSVQRLQRKPSDYQHAEDGGEVRSRLNSRFRSEIRENRAPSGEGASAEARRSSSAANPAEVRSRTAELRQETRPSVDRPAQEQPRVEQSAANVEAEATSPPDPLVQGEAQAEPKLNENAGEATGTAEQAAGLAQQAFAAAAAQPEPAPETPVQPPEPVSPVDAAGEPLEADPAADNAVMDIADRIQYLREQGTLMKAQAAEGHSNAEIIRGNIARVSGEVGKAEEGIAKAQEHASYRREVVGQAEQALGVSQEKQATVAAQAPGFQSKADEGKEDSGPMSSEASSLAAENSANVPDDEEAAAKSREQGGKINQVDSDAATMDGAISQTRSRADSLAQDATRAAELNTQTQGKISTGQQHLDQTDQRLSQHESQTSQARAQVEGMAGAPDQAHAQATQLDDQGQQLIASSFELEDRLRQSQLNYATGMQAIPPVEPWRGEMPEETEEGTIQAQGDGTAPATTAASSLTIPVTPPPAASGAPATSTPATPAPATSVATPTATPVDQGTETELEPGATPETEPADAAASDTAAPEGEATGTAPTATGDAASEDAAVDAAPEDSAQALAAPEELGPRQERVDLEQEAPPWLTGLDPDSIRSREDRRQELENQRREEVGWFNQQLGGRSVAQIGMGQRFGLVGQALTRRFQNIVKNIKWPGWGGLAKMLLDPRSMIAGAVGGLGMILAGGANLFSLEQWRRDPLGNLLTSSANIATGLAVILGSITALAGLVAAIMGALILITFGGAAPLALPVISVCTTIITTVGGWTIAVGKIALVLQALALIKNLIDVATAQTADDLQRETEEISGNINGGFQAVMSIVGAKGAQAGLSGVRNRTTGILSAARRAGGARALARQTLRAAPGRVVAGARALPGRIAAGARSAATSLRALPGRAIAGARALPGRLARGVADTARSIVNLPGRLVRGARSRFRRLFGRQSRRGRPDPSLARRHHETLQGTRRKAGRELTPRELDAELDMVSNTRSRSISQGQYDAEVNLPNGHTWRRDRRTGRWCRFSNQADICATPHPSGTTPTASPTSTADRLTANSVDEVRHLRNNPPTRPPNLSPEDAALWDDYMIYYNNRLNQMERQLGSGRITAEPPRTWTSYQKARTSGATAEALRGRAHQQRVTRSMDEAGDFLTESDVGLSRRRSPGREQVVYTDQLILDRVDGSVTAVSNKSRNFITRAGENLQSDLALVRQQVVEDVNELFTKYSGNLYVRRPQHPLFNQRISVREVVLVYDSRLVTPDLARLIQSVANAEARRINPGITFHISFQ
ncbi:eCIS core domain-containing protein [Leptolyngbya ohadii]|uniref:eCIS core domain-containing protein n=1 Tax=Leptolyngbya ohadii TaxID=1962290 RepID=UPI000B5A0257|nr:DUF4157 domain-containing protein [Leptolyngbya ohadii]